LGIAENIAEVKRMISRALQRSSDPSREIKLVAVSKTFPIEKMTEAIAAGLTRFGENRVQEIVAKHSQLRNEKLEWHFIGHLQTNKIKKLLEVPTEYIHSVDRIELAIELDKQLQKRGETRKVLIEVNTSGETTKSGVEPEKAAELVRAVARFDTIKIMGLMTIGALTENKDVVRRCFVNLRKIFFRIRDEGIDKVNMKELSMGMSSDFEIAVEEGATLVRIGTAIFGERKN
jgi:pyridoxal phosphate enzyme (YggS family)